MLNLERLRVLQAVADAGSVHGAAAVLHVTTSAVSQQLTRLQREVGQPLVERSGRGIRLTDAAHLLVRHTADILDHVVRAESELAEHRGAVAGELAVAAFASAGRGLLPRVLASVREDHSALTVRSSEAEPDEAIPLLLRGGLDVAVMQDWAASPLPLPEGLSRRDLFEDPFDVALPAGHPAAGRASVDLRDLAGDDWITWSGGQLCHDWLTVTLRQAGVEPRIVHTAAEHATQLALVSAGLGVALLPRLGREPVPDSVRFVRPLPGPSRRVFAVWRTSASRRPAVAAFLRAVRSDTKSVEIV